VRRLNRNFKYKETFNFDCFCLDVHLLLITYKLLLIIKLLLIYYLVNLALTTKAKAWTFKAKAMGLEAMAKAMRMGLKASWGQGLPPGLHHCIVQWQHHIVHEVLSWIKKTLKYHHVHLNPTVGHKKCASQYLVITLKKCRPILNFFHCWTPQ